MKRWNDRRGVVQWARLDREISRVTHFVVCLRLHFKLFFCCIPFGQQCAAAQSLLWSAVKWHNKHFHKRMYWVTGPVVWLGLEMTAEAMRWNVWMQGSGCLALELAAWLSATKVRHYFNLTDWDLWPIMIIKDGVFPRVISTCWPYTNIFPWRTHHRVCV